jgi:bacillolysin
MKAADGGAMTRAIRRAGVSSRVALVVALLAGGMASSLPASMAQAPPAAAALEQRLVDGTAGRGRLARHAATGKVRFFGTDQEHPLANAASTGVGRPPEAAARRFLASYGDLFGAADEARQLRLRRVAEADNGRANVRFQQVHNGVPVFAGELVVNLDRVGDVLSAGGELSTVSELGTQPRLGPAAARSIAIEAMGKSLGVPADTLAAVDPELWIYDPSLLLGPRQRPPVLVWRTEVTAGDDAAVRELVLVDAITGGIALHYNQVAHAKNRRICDRNNTAGGAEACVAPYTRVEGAAPTGVVDVDTVYTHSGNVYDYFFNHFGRDSIDGAGMALTSTVRFCPPAGEGSCPYQNAYWNGSQLVLGAGFISDDLVGHEFTHGVTDRESNLAYFFQSGAINESLSDVFGELIDLGNGLGNDSAGVRWLQGEDLAAGVIRNMSNPPAFGDPDAMDSPNYWTSFSDAGGVHTNSGVNNKAAFLMTDGGTHNGVTVVGLGPAKVAQIYYEANANLLTTGNDYQDLYDILKQACLNKVGTAGIATADCTQAENAAKATKMNLTAPASAPEAPVCAPGETPTNLFFDGMENPASGNWSTGGSGAGGWVYDSSYARSGVRSLFAAEPEVVSDRFAARSAAVVPPAGKQTFLRFDHDYDLEEDFDGGLVEYSTNNGGSWIDAKPLFVNNGYNWTNEGGPLGGRQVFSNSSRGFISSRLDLSSLAGQNVRVRFRLLTDGSVAFTGWSVDDVRVYTCAGAAAARPVADFDGNGTTDIGVFRPSAGTWYVRNGATTALGLTGDVPVPGDYDGNGTADAAVFRPAVGGWYRTGAAPVFFGLNGDIPVPADYDGNGTTDLAVYRPSVGGWYIQGAAPVFFGLNGDIPVPGDYDGNGTADIAVYRPTVGGWYRNGAAAVFFGLNGDIPVPGDYDGNGTADVTVYRPSVGGWYRNGAATAFLGLSTDVPQPGDYDGNGTTDLAVFRPATGAWYVQGQPAVFFGVNGDLPLSLPSHIRRSFYPT